MGWQPKLLIVLGIAAMWWLPPKTERNSLRKRILDATRIISERLADESVRENAINRFKSQTELNKNLNWTECSLGFGGLGLSLALKQASKVLVDDKLLKTAHQLFQDDVQSLNGANPDIGLFGGIGGVLMVATILSDGRHYRGLLNDIDLYIESQLPARCKQIVEKEGPIAPLEFDIMGGLCGTALALMFRSDSEVSRGSLTRVTSTLEKLCLLNPSFLRLATHPRDWPDRGLASKYPDGYLNLGLAHGLPGVLGVLCQASLIGIETGMTKNVIRSLSDFIVSNAVNDEFGVNWPAAISIKREGVEKPAATRAAWCYGAPGVLSTLALASNVLKDEKLKSLATAGMDAVFSRPIERLSLYSPTLCHGKAGVVLMAAEVFRLSLSSHPIERVETQVESILELVSSDHLLGVMDQEQPGLFTDNPGLLEGATGVALSLASLADDDRPSWLRLLMQS